LGGTSGARDRRAGDKPPARDEQIWPMLIFESLSAGGIAVLLVLGLALVLVGFYVGIVWPLTKWDLAHINQQTYLRWCEGTLWLIFAAGSGAGFWYFSGAAFREKPARTAGNTPPRIPQGPSAGQGGAVPRFP